MNTWLLIVGSAVCAVLAGLFIVVRVKYGGVWGVVTKALASLAFVTFALVLAFDKAIATGALNIGAAFLIAGLVCGLIGDILLDLKVVYQQDDKKYLTAGMLAFTLGHLFYIAGAVTLIQNITSIFVGSNLLYLLFAFGLSVILTLAIYFISTKALKMNFERHTALVVIYTFLLTFVCAFAITFTVLLPSLKLWLFAVGGVFFFLSDLVLSTQYFGGKQTDKALTIINHVLYYIAQIILAIFVLAF